jgi:threonine aldolase
VRSFGSDNHSGVHPKILQALIDANVDHAPSYGTDAWSERAETLFRREFGEKAEVFFVFNGTAANVTSLRALIKSHESVLCTDVSHLNMDECAAPEFFTGGKLITVPHSQGKMSLEQAREALIRRGDQHYAQVRAVSLTQPTEMGTCYSLDELRAFADWAHKEGLFLHVDGARLANAAHFLGVSFRELITETGVDVVSFGGTKNGLLMGEAVVFLNPALAKDYKYIRKQSAQLPSKTRFVAAQFEAYLKDGLWKEITAHSHKMARLLASELASVSQAVLTAPTESNGVFARVPQPWVKKLREKYFFYVWDEKTFECRFMTSWDTRSEEVHDFVRLMKELT